MLGYQRNAARFSIVYCCLIVQMILEGQLALRFPLGQVRLLDLTRPSASLERRHRLLLHFQPFACTPLRAQDADINLQL